MRLRPLLAALVVALASLAAAAPAPALVTIDVTEGDARLLPIAIPDFSGQVRDDDVAGQITEVVRRNLANSGLFRVIDASAYVEQTLGVSDLPRFGD